MTGTVDKGNSALQISDNVVADNNADEIAGVGGIDVEYTSDSIFANNLSTNVSGHQDYGLRELSNCAGNIFRGNKTKGNVSGGVLTTGTGSLDIQNDNGDALPELLLNGGFAANTTNWSASSCSLASVAGGQAGNCLELTRTGGGYQIAQQTFAGLIVGASYTFSGYVKSGTSGDGEAFYFNCMRAVDFADSHDSGEHTTTSTWTQYSVVFVATAPSYVFSLYKYTATAGTMLFDTVSVTRTPNTPLNQQ